MRRVCYWIGMPIFVDESMHDGPDFIVAALVFADEEIQHSVDAALTECGYRPGVDEFKSSMRMMGNEKAHSLREKMQRIVTRECKLGIVVCSRAERQNIGNLVARLAVEITARTDSEPQTIYLDQGITMDPALLPVGWMVRTGQDSRVVGGIQVADCAAFGAATLLLAELGLNSKMVPPGDYPSDEPLELAWVLWTGLRYPMAGQPWPGDGRLVPSEHDPYGLLISDNVPAAVRAAAELRLGMVWMGCIY